MEEAVKLIYDKTISDLKDFFATKDLPNKVKISNHATVLNGTKFVQSEFMFIDANRYKPITFEAIKRLKLYAEKIK
jgi:hypothetical protein